jgi:hypothetical protein
MSIRPSPLPGIPTVTVYVQKLCFRHVDAPDCNLQPKPASAEAKVADVDDILVGSTRVCFGERHLDGQRYESGSIFGWYKISTNWYSAEPTWQASSLNRPVYTRRRGRW